MSRLICSLGTQAKLCTNYFVLGESEKDNCEDSPRAGGERGEHPNISPQNYPFKGTKTLMASSMDQLMCQYTIKH